MFCVERVLVCFALVGVLAGGAAGGLVPAVGGGVHVVCYVAGSVSFILRQSATKNSESSFLRFFSFGLVAWV